MILMDKQKQDIIEEFNEWKDKMYADKSLAERQDFGQFFTIRRQSFRGYVLNNIPIVDWFLHTLPMMKRHKYFIGID